MNNITSKKNQKPKAHGRSRVTYDQGEYIAEGLRYYINMGFANSREDQKIYFLQLSRAFIENGGDGKVVEKIPDTTLYNFLEKHNIAPYTKRNNSEVMNTGYLNQSYEKHWSEQCNQSTQASLVPNCTEDFTGGYQQYQNQTVDIQQNQDFLQDYQQQSNDCQENQQEYYGQEQKFGSWGESSGNYVPCEQDLFPQFVDESKNFDFFNQKIDFEYQDYNIDK